MPPNAIRRGFCVVDELPTAWDAGACLASGEREAVGGRGEAKQAGALMKRGVQACDVTRAVRPTRGTQAERPPLSRGPHGVEVWGIPIDLAWWRREHARSPEAVRGLCLGDNLAWGTQGNFAALVAAAAEEVRFWERSGVLVQDRVFADLGGGDGYYAVALMLAGARRVLLVDEALPSAAAAPVLVAVGVDVLHGDITKLRLEEPDSALLLYTCLPPEAAFSTCRGLRTLITNDLDCLEADAWLASFGWRAERSPSDEDSFFLHGDGAAVPAESPFRPTATILRGERLPATLPAARSLEDEWEEAHEIDVPQDSTGDAGGAMPAVADDDNIPF